MIKNEQKFAEWIGENELVSDEQIRASIKHLKVIAILIGEDLTEKNLFDENCIKIISKRLRGLRSKKSILNYELPLRQYVKMIENIRKTTLANNE